MDVRPSIGKKKERRKKNAFLCTSWTPHQKSWLNNINPFFRWFYFHANLNNFWMTCFVQNIYYILMLEHFLTWMSSIRTRVSIKTNHCAESKTRNGPSLVQWQHLLLDPQLFGSGQGGKGHWAAAAAASPRNGCGRSFWESQCRSDCQFWIQASPNEISHQGQWAIKCPLNLYILKDS